MGDPTTTGATAAEIAPEFRCKTVQDIALVKIADALDQLAAGIASLARTYAEAAANTAEVQRVAAELDVRRTKAMEDAARLQGDVAKHLKPKKEDWEE